MTPTPMPHMIAARFDAVEGRGDAGTASGRILRAPLVDREVWCRRAGCGRGIGGWRECADDCIDDLFDERLGDGLARNQEPGPHRADEEIDDELLVDAGVELMARDRAVEDAPVGEPPGVDDG